MSAGFKCAAGTIGKSSSSSLSSSSGISERSPYFLIASLFFFNPRSFLYCLVTFFSFKTEGFSGWGNFQNCRQGDCLKFGSKLPIQANEIFYWNHPIQFFVGSNRYWNSFIPRCILNNVAGHSLLYWNMFSQLIKLFGHLRILPQENGPYDFSPRGRFRPLGLAS